MLSESERRQRGYYDRIAAVYDRHYADPHALRYRYGVFDRHLGGLELAGRRLLDAMCGGGESSDYFLRRGAEVTGLDLSGAQCRLYARRHPAAACLCASALRAPFPDATFDVVFTESLHHLPPLLDEGVRELTRVLKPGGTLVVWEPSAGSLLDLARKLWYRLDRSYFEENESSIDVAALARGHADRLDLVAYRYGGNLAHLLVQSSMAFRIPPGWVKYYAPLLLPLDRGLERLQGKRSACWVLAQFRKRG